MRIWVDVDNSPHVLIFGPILAMLRERGHEVILSARDHAQTVPLCAQKGLFPIVAGGHSGASKLGKVAGTLGRSLHLRRLMLGRKPDVAASHGSRALTIAAWSIGVPVVTLYDFEKADYRLFNLLSTKVMAPSIIPPASLRAAGLDLSKLRPYPGTKENIYLSGSHPAVNYRAVFSLSEDEVLVVLRPPATTAHYHVMQTDIVYKAVLDELSSRDHLMVVVLPRTAEQKGEAESAFASSRSRMIVPAAVLDGPSLVASADAVLSGGGTMNREAAVLGIPVYTFFGGPLGAVDEHFIELGQMECLRNRTDVSRMQLVRRRAARAAQSVQPGIVAMICDEILSVGATRKC